MPRADRKRDSGRYEKHIFTKSKNKLRGKNKMIKIKKIINAVSGYIFEKLSGE
jgi:hypothetical protein